MWVGGIGNVNKLDEEGEGGRDRGWKERENETEEWRTKNEKREVIDHMIVTNG